jgi:hypothetical protein
MFFSDYQNDTLNLFYGNPPANKEQINNHFLSTLEPGMRTKSATKKKKKKCKGCRRDGENIAFNTHL